MPAGGFDVLPNATARRDFEVIVFLGTYILIEVLHAGQSGAHMSSLGNNMAGGYTSVSYYIITVSELRYRGDECVLDCKRIQGFYECNSKQHKAMV